MKRRAEPDIVKRMRARFKAILRAARRARLAGNTRLTPHGGDITVNVFLRLTQAGFFGPNHVEVFELLYTAKRWHEGKS